MFGLKQIATFAFFTLSINFVLSQDQSVSKRQSELLTQILDGYDKRIKADNVTDKFGLWLVNFDFNQRTNVLEAAVWFLEEWNDPRLSFDEVQFGESSIKVPSTEIWTPDVILYNSANYLESTCLEGRATIKSDGTISLTRPCNLKAHCNPAQLNSSGGPFGPMSCNLKFGSWNYNNDFSFDIQSSGISSDQIFALENYGENTRWDLISASSERVEQFHACCEEPYRTLDFNLVFRRKSRF